MAASLITYTTKSDNTVSGLAADKKVAAVDMNEIKTALNTNAGLHDTLQTNFTALEARSGSVPLTYTFLTATTASDPGAGKLKLNNASAASATAVYISATDNNISIDDLLTLMVADSYLYIQSREDSEAGSLFKVVTITDNTTWFSLSVTHISSGHNPIANNELCSLALLPYYAPGAGSGDIATDLIWDVKGDAVFGSGSNTAVRMAAGSNGQLMVYDSTQSGGVKVAWLPTEIGVQVGAVAADLAVGTDLNSFVMPYDMIVTDVYADVKVAPVGSTLVIDINKVTTTTLSTKLSIDSTETSSQTAATPAVISDSNFPRGTKISFDVDQVGSTTAGQELTIFLFGYKTSIA